MSSRRTYGDRCGVARALDLVGERWALLVVRELLLGPKRFSDLRAGLPRLSPDVLSQRLRELEQEGVVQRRTLPPPAASRVYELTPWGRELEPAVLALGRWASRTPVPAEGAFGADSTVLALKTLYRGADADGLDASWELRLGEHSFHARVRDGHFEVARGPAEAPDAAIESDTSTLAGLLWHGAELEPALASGAVRLEGDRALAERFLRLFPLPAPVA